jgi:hypothetical protein
MPRTAAKYKAMIARSTPESVSKREDAFMAVVLQAEVPRLQTFSQTLILIAPELSRETVR